MYLDVTVLLTVWKRNNIEEQLNRILEQTISPREIWILHGLDYVSVRPTYHPQIKYIKLNYNMGYHTRFAIALTCKTRYIWIVDDDVIPSHNYLSYIYTLCEEENSIISSSGRIIPFNNYKPEMISDKNFLNMYFIGDSIDTEANTCGRDTLVDFGCTNWFFKKDWLKYFWSIDPLNFKTAEDIHLSATCMILGKVATIVPIQSLGTVCGNEKKYYGGDEFASYKSFDFLTEREKHLKYLIDAKGWKPLNW